MKENLIPSKAQNVQNCPQPTARRLLHFLAQKVHRFHLQQNCPHRLLGSSISAVCSVLIHTVLLLPLGHFRCSQGFPPTNQRRHKSNRSFTRDILRNQENIVMHACCGHFPLCSTFSRNSMISPLVSFGTSRRTLGWKPSHPTPVFALYSLDASSSSPSFRLGSASSNFFNSSFFHSSILQFCTFSSHYQCFAHSFLFASERSNNLAYSSSFFRIGAPPSPCCRLRDFVQESSASLRTLDHLRDFL